MILTVNAGSSSIRLALFGDSPTVALVRVKVGRLGQDSAGLALIDAAGRVLVADRTLHFGDPGAVAALVLAWIRNQAWSVEVAGIGHRVVHGGDHAAAAVVDPALVKLLQQRARLSPQHLPLQLGLIDAFGHACPQVPQLACFDTSFHRDMPQVARCLAIPRRYRAEGIERYGFHGLSYEFCMSELRRAGDPAADRGRVILAHLGNGSSLAAVLQGKGIETSMGFSPAAGLPMGTRSGDLDPGLPFYLAQTEGMTPAQFDRMVTRESGLLGISETSSDLRDLLAREASDPRAAEAIDFFTYQVRKWIGSFAAVLGGVDTLVFTGGIGEHAAPIRARICEHLAFLGIALDAERNAGHAPVISAANARTTVRVIATDEEVVILRAVRRHLEHT